MRLSRALGKTKSELLDVLDEDELSEQIAFDQFEPMDNPYWRNGLLIEVLIRVLGSGKGSKLKPELWMPAIKQRKVNTLKELDAKLNAWAGGR
ncbi:hypothetical protein [Thalassoglobus sp.]|uniref:hypothetical protein n=1 Tax=Thalassoglobus sp. TaxID=2795869 RepID=UPI003AA87747